MNWNGHHNEAEEYAQRAELAALEGQCDLMRDLYRHAAEQETLALEQLDETKSRTIGVTAVSAASLWYKSGELRQAERIACHSLARDEIPPFATDQLQTVLHSIWNERTLQSSQVEFTKGEVLVRVAGGSVVHGGAPLDLVHLKVDQVRSLVYRTIEMLLNLPVRKRGSPSAKIQQQFRPWLLQAPAGSYQFAVRVQRPAQIELFPEAGPDLEDITKRALDIVDASALESMTWLEELIEAPDYVDVFLRLTRDMAPTGKSFKTLEMRPSTATERRPVVLTPDSRETINSSLRSRKKEKQEPAEMEEQQISGVLRALHLDADWLEVARSEPPFDHVKVYKTGDVIDDIVGPLVNHLVLVDVAIAPDGKLIFRDIQLDE